MKQEKDVRITVRLNEEIHKKFKVISVKKGKTMNDILLEYICELVKEEDENDKSN